MEYFKVLGDFSLTIRLNKALVEMLAEFVYNGMAAPALDFCHKLHSNYFHSNGYTLRYGEEVLANWELAP